MINKIQLLMEETGCDEGEAELALEMCGYEVEAAVKALPRLLKNIAVLKAKFNHPEANQYGLLLVIGNIKTRDLLRARAVLSYNPAVYAVPLEKDWFDFERALYGCRLWDGSLPAESLEIEHALAQHFRAGLDPKLFGSDDEGVRQASEEMNQTLGRLLRAPGLEIKVKPEVLDLGQFRSLGPKTAPAAPGVPERPAGPAPRAQDPRAPGEKRKPAPGGPMGRPGHAPGMGDGVQGRRAGHGEGPAGPSEPLVLGISLLEDPEGTAAEDLRPGDFVGAFIVDGRDIAQYIAKLLGGQSDRGAAAIMAPVEAVESVPAGEEEKDPPAAQGEGAAPAPGDPKRPSDATPGTGGGGARPPAPVARRVRVRFAVGVCGSALLPGTAKYKVERRETREVLQQPASWWRRLFKS